MKKWCDNCTPHSSLYHISERDREHRRIFDGRLYDTSRCASELIVTSKLQPSVFKAGSAYLVYNSSSEELCCHHRQEKDVCTVFIIITCYNLESGHVKTEEEKVVRGKKRLLIFFSLEQQSINQSTATQNKEARGKFRCYISLAQVYRVQTEQWLLVAQYLFLAVLSYLGKEILLHPLKNNFKNALSVDCKTSGLFSPEENGREGRETHRSVQIYVRSSKGMHPFRRLPTHHHHTRYERYIISTPDFSPALFYHTPHTR